MSVSNRRVADIINEVEEGRLILRPAFQRRLVWTNINKEHFIDTVLRNYPFPEIFVATGTLDAKKIRRTNWLVDGQQRITTLRNYVKGSDDLLYKVVPRFASLSDNEQTNFLNYELAVRDLGSVSEREIKEIFARINSTDYSLKSMEILNAQYSGAYQQYCVQLSGHLFFKEHKVFSAAYQKRMHDVAFCVNVVTTMLCGYYRRDERNAEFLERYNDDFPEMAPTQSALDAIFDFINRCNFDKKSRVWKQTDLFTLIVELNSALVVRKLMPDPNELGTTLGQFYEQVDKLYRGDLPPGETAGGSMVQRYLKAATKATNDKYARVERAEIVCKLIESAVPKAERERTDREQPTAKARSAKRQGV